MRGTDRLRLSRNGTLEPLDVVGLLPPFHQANPSQSDPTLCDSPSLDETPTTATTSLPTPGRPPPLPDVLQYVHRSPISVPSTNTTLAHPSSIFGQSDQAAFACTIYPAEWHSLQPPPAPKLQDMDSFTEGTAVGSFDISLRSSWSSENFPERPPPVDSPAREIESWRTEVLLSTLSALPSSSSAPITSKAAEDEGDEISYFDPDLSCEHSLDPASWHATPTRAPKRQLSYTSVDGDRTRGRKLIRHAAAANRSCSQSIPVSLDDGDNHDPGVDRSRSARSSSAPSAI